MTYLVAAMVAMAVLMVLEIWCLWRVLNRLGALGRVEERLSVLTHTMTLLTDTTETCFQTVAGQLEQDRPSRSAPQTERVARQRRVVGAARRGRSVSEIATQEEVAESEVRLRLLLAQPEPEPKRGHHGAMLT